MSQGAGNSTIWSRNYRHKEEAGDDTEWFLTVRGRLRLESSAPVPG